MMFGQMMLQMQQLIDTMSRGSVQVTPHNRLQEDCAIRVSPSSSERTTVGSASPANAVILLALQIPEFTGEASDNVRRWVQRVDQVTRAHRASDEVTMLAVSSKLTKLARKWYDSQSGAVLDSWANLKESLRKMFERRVPFLVSMQKIETRKWMQIKELFQEYAIDKMSMLYGLDLSNQDIISLLIGGITNEALRSMAATIQAVSVEDFIDQMCQLSATVGQEQKEVHLGSKQQSAKYGDRQKDSVCKNCGKKGHGHKECRATTITYFYCKEKGHKSYECPKAKGKISQRRQLRRLR